MQDLAKVGGFPRLFWFGGSRGDSWNVDVETAESLFLWTRFLDSLIEVILENPYDFNLHHLALWVLDFKLSEDDHLVL